MMTIAQIVALLLPLLLYPLPPRDTVWLENVTPIYADLSIHNSCDDTPWWNGPVIEVYYEGGVDWYQFEDAYIIERDEWCHYRLTFEHPNKPIYQMCLAWPLVPVAGVWLQDDDDGRCWKQPMYENWLPIGY